jgi:hypothetical protein
MKYAMLIYPAPGSHEAQSEAEQQATTAEYMALRDEDGFLEGARLQPEHTATTLTMQGGQVLATDGPFADTKEVLGGYYVFEADNLDRALELAGRIPAIRLGGAVEVRPVVEIPVAYRGA